MTHEQIYKILSELTGKNPSKTGGWKLKIWKWMVKYLKTENDKLNTKVSDVDLTPLIKLLDTEDIWDVLDYKTHTYLVGVGKRLNILEMKTILKNIIKEELKNFLQESDSVDAVDEFNKLKVQMQALAKQQGFQYIEDTQNQIIIKPTKYHSNQYEVHHQPNHEYFPFYIWLIDVIELSSRSLADPRVRYQTTSARIVKNKKVKTNGQYETYKEVIKKLNSHMKKVGINFVFK